METKTLTFTAPSSISILEEAKAYSKQCQTPEVFTVTQEEFETFAKVMRKLCQPSAAVITATMEGIKEGDNVYHNIIADDSREDQYNFIFGAITNYWAEQIASKLMIFASNVKVPKMEEIQVAMNAIEDEHQLVPGFFNRPTVFSAYMARFLSDPMMLIGTLAAPEATGMNLIEGMFMAVGRIMKQKTKFVP